jgi:hypothetical protein
MCDEMPVMREAMAKTAKKAVKKMMLKKAKKKSRR